MAKMWGFWALSTLFTFIYSRFREFNMSECQKKELENGSGPIIVQKTGLPTLEDRWDSNGKPSAHTSAISLSLLLPQELNTYKDMSASPPPVLCEESNKFSSPLPFSQEFTWKSPEAPKLNAVRTRLKTRLEHQTLALVSSSLVDLKTSLTNADKELETISTLLLSFSEPEEHCKQSPRNMAKRMSSSIVDSSPSNPLFTQAPEFATKEEYFSHHGCSGSTDPLEPERLWLSLKRPVLKRSTANPEGMTGGMDTVASP